MIEPKSDLSLSGAFIKKGNDAINWLHDEFNRFKDFVAAKAGQPELAGVTLQDGDNIVEGVLRSFDDDTIKEFGEQFL